LMLWDEYVENNNVILPSRSPFEGLYDVLPVRFPVDAGYPPLVNKRQYTPPQELIKSPKQ
jgi:hypothetical protein